MKGLWRHADLFDPLPSIQPTLGEGDTPLTDLPALARSWGLESLRLKREDLNPSGSHKDRGLVFQVASHHGASPRTHVISSSGNAATSAAAACAACGDRLVAFVSADTDPAKLGRIADRGGVVLLADKPVNFARYAARVFGLINLRGTADPLASVGYRSLGAEIAEAGADHALTFSSSGVSAEGMLDGFARRSATTALWSVQSGLCIALARALDADAIEDADSPAGRLGAKNPPGAEALAARLQAGGGGAIALSGSAVERGRAHLRSVGLQGSAEGAAVLAAVQDLARAGRIGGRVVAVITGAAHAPTPPPPVVALSSYLDVRAFFVDVLGLGPL